LAWIGGPARFFGAVDSGIGTSRELIPGPALARFAEPSAFAVTNKFRDPDFTGVTAERHLMVTILRVGDDPLEPTPRLPFIKAPDGQHRLPPTLAHDSNAAVSAAGQRLVTTGRMRPLDL
jgi:hypothetical protein